MRTALPGFLLENFCNSNLQWMPARYLAKCADLEVTAQSKHTSA